MHMRDPHLAAIEMTLQPENWDGMIEIKSALNGRVRNTGVKRYQDLDDQHLAILGTEQVSEDTIALQV